MAEAEFVIRPEQPGDIAAIYDLTARAFATAPHAGGTEPAIVNALRAAGALTLSLVAEQQGRVIGHVAFSPVIGDCGWHSLGPISVEPAVQKRGIGRALVAEGLARLKITGGKGCVLVGNPAYYGPLGFIVCPHLAPPNVPAEYFMLARLIAEEPVGPLEFHPAFFIKG